MKDKMIDLDVEGDRRRKLSQDSLRNLCGKISAKMVRWERRVGVVEHGLKKENMGLKHN